MNGTGRTHSFRAIGRRRFLSLAGSSMAGALLLGSCGDDGDGDGGDDAGAPAGTPGGAASPSGGTPAARATATATQASAGDAAQGTALVSDVLDHRLRSDDWAGEFGWVRFRLHAAAVDGEDAYFIRTDASDQAFAEAEGLVFVPRMQNALDAADALNAIYLFEDGAEGQAAVIRAAPHRDDYSPAFRIHLARGQAGEAVRSEEALLAAADAGALSVEATDVVVNYPVVKWPGGELPHDEALEAYLGGGQLTEPVDVEAMTVTFKLHACYPNSRYIVTDVSMPPMADGMHIAPAPGAAALTEAGATAKILVFGNGIEGSGPMGFQKSITDTVAGEPEWSPYWDHYTFVWAEGAEPATLTSEEDVIAQEGSGGLERFSGTPDTHPDLFMVNCPVPVVAPVA